MTPTKEQIEALAGVLHCIHPGPAPWPGAMTSDEMAAAVLAALSPDWCGHDPTHRERCHNYDPDAVIAHLHRVNDDHEAEIARLRAALKETYGLAFVANEGDDWYARNAGIDAEAVLARAHAILAPKADPPT